MSRIRKFNELVEPFEDIKAEVNQYLNDISDEFDDVTIFWDWEPLSGEERENYVCVTIPHEFYGEAELKDFKKYKKIIDKIDHIIDILLSEKLIYKAMFDERSNAEINLLLILN